MNLAKLFDMQNELDSRIEKLHNLDSNELFSKKLLALLVELGELANETRCFKFWSLKAPSEKAVILDEFADGLHFILSLGILLKAENQIDLKAELTQIVEPTTQFIKVYQLITELNSDRTLEKMNEVFMTYLELGNLLGFSKEDIENAYFKKNEVNHKRQDSGY
ncbi:MAG: dUTPase [Bacillales bacterium]|jgi:dimeric dUTPase (all-alpha-NTP-PPase superfamily)|nr:dUTPase [Bacillales bacterium]